MQLAVSTVIFALRADEQSAKQRGPELWLPLVCRVRDPYDGYWALPGGPLGDHEGLADSAARTLDETTGLRPAYLEQLYAFGEPERGAGAGGVTRRTSASAPKSAADRMVSIVYWALLGSDEAARARVGQNVRWLTAERLPRLAFDHNLIVEYALWRLRTKIEYARIAHAFLGETFTLSELREVHEIVLQRDLDPANFRRQIEASNAVVRTEEFRTGGRHRPARLYRYNSAIEPVDLGPLAPRNAPPSSPDQRSRP
ncbi:NUDIX hydrolase [Ruania zhangjianzhongii]|uniref:NUDIX hydrolase n=1 Tax=Ruania zhangjianzhongii TaxID=2603206 RepID=UPI0011C78754|nr:NUDIX domain-containing protein [Ruania zhangjianzhongii]